MNEGRGKRVDVLRRGRPGKAELQSQIVWCDVKFDVGLPPRLLQKDFERVAHLPEPIVVPLGVGEDIRIREFREDEERIPSPTGAHDTGREVRFGSGEPSLAKGDWRRIRERRSHGCEVIKREVRKRPAVDGGRHGDAI